MEVDGGRFSGTFDVSSGFLFSYFFVFRTGGPLG